MMRLICRSLFGCLRQGVLVWAAVNLGLIVAFLPLTAHASVPKERMALHDGDNPNAGERIQHQLRELILNIPTASREQNYRGTVVYFRGQTMNSLEVVHRWKEGLVQEKLVQLDGEMGEILRNGDEVICYLPNKQAVRLNQSVALSPLSSAALDAVKLERHYTLASYGEDRVAGYAAHKVALMAKDKDRFSYLLWLENGSGLLLKSILMDAQGEMLERFQFSSLQLSVQISELELQPSLTVDVMKDKSNTGKMASTSMSGLLRSWKPGWLPMGYTQVEGKAPYSERRANAWSQAYSDGLSSFTIFVEPWSRDTMPEGGARVGATIAYGRKVDLSKGAIQITVVGEIPAQTAMKVAERIELGLP